MRISKFSWWVIFALQLCSSCAGNSLVNPGESPAKPAQGILHKRVTCRGDSLITYALYIPPDNLLERSCRKGATNEKRYAAMVAFDPHGDGVLPLSLYRDIADQFGMIMIGSNDSKNGIDGRSLERIIRALMSELSVGYPVDTGRIYLLGFSGGARVATLAALHLVPVKGVIGCGAGFGDGAKPARFRFDFYGMAGTSDFNMQEILGLDELLTCNAFHHAITTYPGRHEWPPAKMIEEAFGWHTINAMKAGMLKKDTLLVTAIIRNYQDRVLISLKAKNLYEAAGTCGEAIAITEWLGLSDWFKEQLSTIGKAPGYAIELKAREHVLGKEEVEKEELMNALQARSINWWKSTIARLQANDNTNFSPTDTLFYYQREQELKNQRLLSFLSLYCYMNATSAIARHQYASGLNILEIYELADVSNPEPNYLRAVLMMQHYRVPDAIKELQTAVNKGFRDKKRMIDQREFTELQNSPDWVQLLTGIEQLMR